MSIGPVSGKNGIKITLPQNYTCFWAAFTQAAFIINLTIKDGNGNVVVNQSGNGIHFNLLGANSFKVVQANIYTVYITANGGQDVSILWGESQLIKGSNIYSSTLNFVGEDGVDQDYNDIFLCINWFEFSN